MGIQVILIQPGTTKTHIAMQHEFPMQVQNEEYSPICKVAVDSFRHRFETEGMALPEDPARVIYEAAVSRGYRYRYVTGRDAKLVNFMQRILPEHTLKGMVFRMTGLSRITNQNVV